MSREAIVHPIPPLYREDSQILILGSFPSVKSRESAFFYKAKQQSTTSIGATAPHGRG